MKKVTFVLKGFSWCFWAFTYPMKNVESQMVSDQWKCHENTMKTIRNFHGQWIFPYSKDIHWPWNFWTHQKPIKFNTMKNQGLFSWSIKKPWNSVSCFSELSWLFQEYFMDFHVMRGISWAMNMEIFTGFSCLFNAFSMPFSWQQTHEKSHEKSHEKALNMSWIYHEQIYGIFMGFEFIVWPSAPWSRRSVTINQSEKLTEKCSP